MPATAWNEDDCHLYVDEVLRQASHTSIETAVRCRQSIYCISLTCQRGLVKIYSLTGPMQMMKVAIA